MKLMRLTYQLGLYWSSELLALTSHTSNATQHCSSADNSIETRGDAPL